jgi:hypothetical protein
MWFYEMNADPTLKPITKQILGVLAMKKGNEIDLDGERVVKVKASHSEIAEWTGHHKVTISNQLKVAVQHGWIEVAVRGDGAGNKSTYLFAYPEKVSDVTTERLATSLPKGKSSDYRKVSQKSSNQQLEAPQCAQVPEVLEGTEGTGTARRARVTRAPRTASPKKQVRSDYAPDEVGKPVDQLDWSCGVCHDDNIVLNSDGKPGSDPRICHHNGTWHPASPEELAEHGDLLDELNKGAVVA